MSREIRNQYWEFFLTQVFLNSLQSIKEEVGLESMLQAGGE